MTARTDWPNFNRHLVAILRGIRSDETKDIVHALVDAGFEAIEIPLNSPDPFEAIEIAAKAVGDRCLIGAGTVLSVDDVDALYEVGGRLMVSPNIDQNVVRRASFLGMVTLPGVFTATEAHTALRAGSSALKFFPASALGPSGINAIKSILPPGTELAAVGGVSEVDFEAYSAVGVRSFGLGSSLFKPGMSADEVASRARKTIETYNRVFVGQDQV